MALPTSLKLFIDANTGVAYSSFAGSQQVNLPSFYAGDKAQLEIYLIKETGVSNYPRQEVSVPGNLSIKVAVGQIDESPTAGSWKVGFDGEVTAPLAYNITAAALESAINLLPTITAAGGVKVSKIGDNYNISFNANGLQEDLTTDGSGLIPLSVAGVNILQVGDANKPQVYLVHLQRTVAAYSTDFSPVSASTISITSLAAWDGTRATYRLIINPDPKAGTFSLGFSPLTGTAVSTSAIAVGASSIDVTNALSLGVLVGKVQVQQVGGYAYDITVNVQPGSAGLTANASGIASFNGYKGEIDFNTSSAIALLDGAEQVQTFLEVEITSDSKPLTVLQIPCLLKSSVVDEASVQPVVLETYLSQSVSDGRYFRIANNLSEGVANTIRSNLSVPTISTVDSALALKADLSGATFTGTVYAPTLRNILNTDLVVDSYNDDGAGTHYLHKFTPFDGKLVLAPNGGGLTFPDSTTQTTAFDSADYVTTVDPQFSGEGIFTSEGQGESKLYGGTYQAYVKATPTTLCEMTFGGLLITSDGGQLGATVLNRGSLTLLTGSTQTQTIITGNTSTFGGKVTLPASTSGSAPLRITAGVNVVTNPQVGDLWNEQGVGLRFRATSASSVTFATRDFTNTFTVGQVISCSEAAPALRVTQEGPGHALVVDDSTNPDTSAFIIDTNGKVGIQRNPASFATPAGTVLEVGGKSSFLPLNSRASINIGTVAATPTVDMLNGDMWIGGTLNFRNSAGLDNIVACLGVSNQFSTNQIIQGTSTSAMLRVTQGGTGAAILVQDEANPDTSAFVVDASGNLGVNVNPATFSPTNKVEIVGAIRADSITFNGTAQFKVNGTQSHASGSNTHDLLISFNGSTYRLPMVLVSTP
jgi:hypothetical protein